MSGQKSIDKVALDFITLYKKYKDKSYKRRMKREEESKHLLARNPRRRERLDKHPC